MTASICWSYLQVNRIGGPMEVGKIVLIAHADHYKEFQTLSEVSARYTESEEHSELSQ